MGWYEAMKDAAKVFDQLRDAEARELIANLKVEGAELMEENARLRDEVRQLREQAVLQASLEFVDPVYWRKNEDSREGPFCSRCWDSDHKLIHLHDRSAQTAAFWYCPQCDKSVRKN